ncbi:alpha-glucuronidase family glycosyl hydrolase [Paucisalibacillus sp. EB02]|uniref:alpha-glucuronidase family glycosyl hydrolase n=1 Tax=Paucisalibacillus sp. EB02 TaxID=1347087 RepID=UPI0004BA30CC|nr:alpha-glucuronidase family glycosyl hydrolase [Paucisalibacillus sp. EB02]
MIIYFSNHKTVLFAVEELRRLHMQCNINLSIYSSTKIEIPISSERRIYLMLEKDFQLEKQTLATDGFFITQANGDVYIVGESERAILYGVYHYAENQLGYRFVGLKETLQEPFTPEKIQMKVSNPILRRRGTILETIRDPQYVTQLIDWGAKNGLNEFFFTFFLWNEIGSYLYRELEKRNYNVTLGGHSLSFLLGEKVNELEEGAAFFSKESQHQEYVIQRILVICQENPIVRRISLWPEDVGITEKDYAIFMPNYISFVEELKERLSANHLDVEVEHIVYNAGLEWNMLERNPNMQPSSRVDVLYAFWGRNYGESLLNQEENQLRAYQALKDWKQQVEYKHTSLTVLEYYSDHFMLSELFPPLMQRIKKDMKVYQSLGVEGVLNLIVPVHRKQAESELDGRYPWKWVQMMNHYFYAGFSWGKDFNLLCDQFFQLFGEHANSYREFLQQLEVKLANHTSYNIPLFPARIIDPEKVTDLSVVSEIVSYLDHLLAFMAEHSMRLNPSLLTIQQDDNYSSFNEEENLLFYLHYLKLTLESVRDKWREKQ